MNTNIQMIACDLDGTLLRPDKHLSPLTKETLRRVHEAGVLITICSGRPFYSVQRIFQGVPFDYACCGNGQSVYDHEGNALMVKPGLSAGQISELLTLMRSYPVMLNFSIGTHFYHTASRKHFVLIRFFEAVNAFVETVFRHHTFHRTVIPLEKVHIDSCEKFCFAGTYRVLKKIAARLDPSVYSAVFVSKNWLEIQPAGISKGSALAFVQAETGIAPAHCAAIGDGENDLSMFAYAGMKIAMGNAMAAVKQKADITVSSCIKDGAARWMTAAILD
jgi:Cof subfamily protein (haloacid dehalogenase superfamily)